MRRKRLQPCQSTIIVTLTCVFAGKFGGGHFVRLLVTTSGRVVMRGEVVLTHSLSTRRVCLPPHKDSGAHWEEGPLPAISSLCRGERAKGQPQFGFCLVAKKKCLSSPNVLETFLAGWSVRLFLTVWLGDCVVEALFVFCVCVCLFKVPR